MRKSIFLKYFAITAAIILTSMIVLGAVLMVFSRNQWVEEKNTLLVKNTTMVAEVSSNVIKELYGGETLESAAVKSSYSYQMKNVLDIISVTIDADIFVVDADGAYVTCADRATMCVHRGSTVSESVMNQVAKSSFSESGTLDGMYRHSNYTVGMPIYEGNELVGAVFASVPKAEATYYVAQTFKVLVVCALLVMLLAFVAIYIISARLSQPLRMMADAAKRMESGDFVQKVPVTSKDEVGLLAEAFNKMSVSLGEVESMRRSFISSVSHELKTPMTTISGFVDGILDGTIPRDQEDKYLRIVSDETKRLARLVNSMLQLSRLESNEMELHPTQFNVTDTVVRVMLGFEQKIESKNIEIRGLEDCEKVMLSADSDLIYQVVYNLVENAIKFTPEGGYIDVHCEKGKQNTVQIRILNSGEGLSQQEMSRIFERFYKTDRSRSTDKTGMGFGLYIVKTIVGLHGGKIVVSSVVGEYTCFDVTLPSAEETEITAEAADIALPADDNNSKKS